MYPQQIELIRHQLVTMYRQERTLYRSPPKYLMWYQRKFKNERDFMLLNDWRRAMCKWCYDIVDHFGRDRESVFVAMQYVDKYVIKCLMDYEDSIFDNDGNSRRSGAHDGVRTPTSVCGIESREFQLVGISALYIAMKILRDGSSVAQQTETDQLNSSTHSLRRSQHGYGEVPESCTTIHKVLSSEDFSLLSRGSYSVKEIEKMEMNILVTLDWCLTPPTPVHYLTLLLQAIPPMPSQSLGFAAETITTSAAVTPPQENHKQQQQEEVDSEKQNVQRRPSTFDAGVGISLKNIKYALFELSQYILEISVSVYEINVVYRPSSVALAAILISMEGMAKVYHGQPHISQMWVYIFEELQKMSPKDNEMEIEYAKMILSGLCSDALLSGQSPMSNHIYSILQYGTDTKQAGDGCSSGEHERHHNKEKIGRRYSDSPVSVTKEYLDNFRTSSSSENQIF